MVIFSVPEPGFLPWNGSFPSLVRTAVIDWELGVYYDVAFLHSALRTERKMQCGRKED